MPRFLFALIASVVVAHASYDELTFEDREAAILAAMKEPRFVPVRLGNLQISVSADYLSVDGVLTPLSPAAAQHVADRFDCIFPTTKMVDAIYAVAGTKLIPRPIPPTPAMTRWRVFAEHSALVATNTTGLVAGHKKDVVISAKLVPGKVAIYGWHRPDGRPIQPLYLGHASSWVDYSHGIRLVKKTARLDGNEVRLDELLANPELCSQVSDEGPIATARYTEKWEAPKKPFNERRSEFFYDPNVRIQVNSPALFHLNKPTRLILYALPNGSTIEQTIGRKRKEGDDQRFDIQHIGAQTRWLRERLPGTNFVVAYLETAEKAWPVWRRKFDGDNTHARAIVDGLRQRFAPHDLKFTLTGHSGGGSFTFGYLNSIPEIPSDIERIAFLDSNYAYESGAHADKLIKWLSSSNKPSLCVLAYHDSIALLNGKTFVSESGGTWGRSHAMLADLEKTFAFEKLENDEFITRRALEGRLQFLLKKNPTKAILHTTQVELNGFIHAMLTGTKLESAGYEYFGPRIYNAYTMD